MLRQVSGGVSVVRSAFTFLEVMAVVVVLGILAAMVIPRMTGVTDDARASALRSSLGGVRAGIAAFRSRAILAGSDPYPTLAQLAAPGTVLQQPLPENPFNHLATVQAVSRAQADSRAVVSSTSFGWNYCIDNASDPPVAIFYANSIDATTVSDGSGGVRGANEL